ncbi:hypothetical protein V6N13_055844 [Hibiscus sabdariffa]
MLLLILIVHLDQHAWPFQISVSFLAHTETIRFISLHRIWDWGTIQFHLLHPLHVVKQLGKATPQVYKGHRKKETVNSVSFFGPKSEYVVNGSGNGRVYIWKKKGKEFVRAKKEHALGVDSIESHPHTTVLASSGADGIKIWTSNATDKAKLHTTKTEQDQ